MLARAIGDKLSVTPATTFTGRVTKTETASDGSVTYTVSGAKLPVSKIRVEGAIDTVPAPVPVTLYRFYCDSDYAVFAVQLAHETCKNAARVGERLTFPTRAVPIKIRAFSPCFVMNTFETVTFRVAVSAFCHASPLRYVGRIFCLSARQRGAESSAVMYSIIKDCKGKQDRSYRCRSTF